MPGFKKENWRNGFTQMLHQERCCLPLPEKKIMALPYLPKEHIPGAFYELKGLANSECLKDFCTDVERQWIVSDFFQPRSWSIYMQDVRTKRRFGGLAQEAQLFCQERPTPALSLD